MKKRKVQKICICLMFALIMINSKHAVAQEHALAYNDNLKTTVEETKARELLRLLMILLNKYLICTSVNI